MRVCLSNPMIHRSRLVSAVGCVLLAASVAFGAAADDESDPLPALGAPRHRMDFGVQWFDAAEGNTYTGSLDYSWVPLDHHGFAVTLPLIGSDLGESDRRLVGSRHARQAVHENSG